MFGYYRPRSLYDGYVFPSDAFSTYEPDYFPDYRVPYAQRQPSQYNVYREPVARPRVAPARRYVPEPLFPESFGFGPLQDAYVPEYSPDECYASAYGVDPARLHSLESEAARVHRTVPAPRVVADKVVPYAAPPSVTSAKRPKQPTPVRLVAVPDHGAQGALGAHGVPVKLVALPDHSWHREQNSDTEEPVHPIPAKRIPLTKEESCKTRVASPPNPSQTAQEPRRIHVQGQEQSASKGVPVQQRQEFPTAVAERPPMHLARSLSQDLNVAPAARNQAGSRVRLADRLTKAEAARIIQKNWRCWRLRREYSALRKIAQANTLYREANVKFYEYMGVTSGHIIHKNMLEVQEMAMRVLLKLDDISIVAHELRDLRKHLVKLALALCDKAVEAWQDSDKRAALNLQTAAASTTVTASPTAAETSQNAAETVVVDGENLHDAQEELETRPEEEETQPQEEEDVDKQDAVGWAAVEAAARALNVEQPNHISAVRQPTEYVEALEQAMDALPAGFVNESDPEAPKPQVATSTKAVEKNKKCRANKKNKKKHSAVAVDVTQVFTPSSTTPPTTPRGVHHQSPGVVLPTDEKRGNIRIACQHRVSEPQCPLEAPHYRVSKPGSPVDYMVSEPFPDSEGSSAEAPNITEYEIAAVADTPVADTPVADIPACRTPDRADCNPASPVTQACVKDEPNISSGKVEPFYVDRIKVLLTVVREVCDAGTQA